MHLLLDPITPICVVPQTHTCVLAGKTSGKIPASQGLIPGTLADSADSFILCN